MALHLARRKQRLPSNSSLLQFISNYSSESFPKDGNAPGEKPSQSPSDSSSSSSSSTFADIKLKLERQAGQGSKPFVRSNTQPQNRGGPLQELAKNLAKFERRSTFRPPRNSSFPSRSGPPKSFAELYKENAGSNSEDRKTQEFNSNKAWENLKNLSAQSNKPGMYSGSFKTLARDNVVGGGEALSMSRFSREMEKKKVKEGENDMEFLRSYSEQELGEKLRMLRPEEGKEFSLQELNERLVKLRQVEERERERQVEEKEREAQSRSGKGDFVHLRNFVGNLERDSANSQQNISFTNLLGDVPEYKLLPPKEGLVDTYFHPDNMSSAEKMKIELTNVREEFKMSESDCGSTRVQVAQLTTRIKHLSTALHKKDKHSRKGLMGMVQKRKKLLKYLRRTDWDSYCLVLSKLGLRDNPDYKF